MLFRLQFFAGRRDSMLEGVKVVEWSNGLAGPVAGLMLAECGAEVIKIEPPGGDPDRGSALFASSNRSKRSLELDLEDSSDRARFDALLEDADVLIHNLTTSRAQALKLDTETLERLYPRLISCAILGAPIGHADEERSDDDFLVQARTGVFGEIDGYREGPIACRYDMGGMNASQMAVSAILTRLIMRLSSGKGGGAHTSLLQGIMGPMSLCWSRIEKNAPPELFMRPPVGAVNGMLFETGDGVWLQIMDPLGKLDYAAMPLMWEALAELGKDDIDDLDDRREGYLQKPHDQWLAAIRELDIPVEPAYGLGEVLNLEDAKLNGYVVEVDDPVFGPVRQAGVPIQSDAPREVKGPAPQLNDLGGGSWTGPAAPEKAARPIIETGSNRPLAGLKLLDFGAFVAGPLAPQVLADLGADCIKVESIEGDRVRFMVRYYQCASRNKRSIAVDLKKPEGQEVLSRLVKWADMAHHNMRMKAAEQMNLDEAGLRKMNPDIIFSYSSAYGQRGERGDWPGYDSIFAALAGWSKENAGKDNPPGFMRAGCMDVLCALTSLVACLAGVYKTAVTGKAVTTEASLLGAACLSNIVTVAKSDGTFGHEGELDQAQTGLGPLRRIYECTDRWIAVSTTDEAALLRAFGADSVAELEDCARGQESGALMKNLVAEGVPAELVLPRDNLWDDIFDNPAHRESRVVVGWEHPDFGLVETPGAFMGFSDAELRLEDPLPAPLIGEHTEEILRMLGYSDAEIAELFANRIVGGPREGDEDAAPEEIYRGSGSGPDGTWDCVMKTSMGDRPCTIVLKVQDDQVSGTMDSGQGVKEIENIELDGDKANWTVEMTAPMKMTLKFSAEVDGDAISGKVKMGMLGSSDFGGTRVT